MDGLSGRPLRLLLIEDSKDDAELILAVLRRGGFAPEPKRVWNADATRDAMRASMWDIVLSDYHMPGFDAVEAISIVREHDRLVPIVIVTGTIGEEIAVEMMRQGACDYVLKDRLVRLPAIVDRELADAGRRAEERRVREHLELSREMLLRSERLRMLGQMAAGITHDLKNVLIGPLGMQLQMAERAMDRADIPRIGAAVADMQRIVSEGLEVIERLRQFGRPNVGELAAGIDLASLVGRAVEIARARVAPGTTPAIAVEFTAETSTAIAADVSELTPALVNLIVNAIDALVPTGGTVSVRCGADDATGWVVISDDGPGVASEVQDHLYEPFVTTKGESGTGLGLAMVYNAVQRHRGTIELVSNPGSGSRFRLTFPRV